MIVKGRNRLVQQRKQHPKHRMRVDGAQVRRVQLDLINRERKTER